MIEQDIEDSTPEVNISLSPESGSLFHSYHSRLTSHLSDHSNKSKNSPKDKHDYDGQRSSKFKRNWRSRDFSRSDPPYSSDRMKKYPCLEMTDYMIADQEAEKHCTKTFHLKDSSNTSQMLWKLPSSDGIYTHTHWKVDELVKMKSELNEVKGQLESYDIELWHKHTHMCNPAQKISYHVKTRAKPELLTQAFLKFYEIVNMFPIIPEENELPDCLLNTLHLCEAPGAFVVALNHFLALQRPKVKWQWVGNTLNPYFEGTPASQCIADDRLILFTLNNWHFGKDETGNLMSVDYLKEMIERLDGNKVNLVTADGSIDCQGNPAEQEAMTHRLHFCELYSALCTLKKGGSLVIKKFTFFEAESVNILYLISCCFDDVYVHKPITSKLGNSEVYIVATGHNPPRYIDQYLEVLLKFYGKETLSTIMFSEAQIPPPFIGQIIDCCKYFKNHQTEAIMRNIKLYKSESEENDQYCHLLKSLVLQKFVENNSCLPIEANKRIVPHRLQWDRHIIPESNVVKWGGQIMKKPKSERLAFLNDQHHTITQYYYVKFSLENYESSPIKYNKEEFIQDASIVDSVCVKEGNPFHFVYVSRFCDINLMQIYVHYLMEFVNDLEMEKIRCHHFSKLPILNTDSHQTSITRLTEQARSEALKDIPNGIILDEGHFAAPHGCHESFDKIAVLLREGGIEEGGSVAVLNCPLLTRLQNGLLTLLSSVFKSVLFYEPTNTPHGIPFFILNNLCSIDKGKQLIDTLGTKGWLPHQKTINQLLPLHTMIQNSLHSAVCRYNALDCISNIYSLKNI